jgi:Domain of unknown function (DUF4265)
MKEDHVKLLFEHNAFNGNDIEGAWAIRENEFYKLDNILFYAKEFSWGDLIKAKERNGELYAEAMVRESGHSTIRLLFKNSEDVQNTRDQLKEMNCDSELSNYEKLVAVNVPPQVSYKKLILFLDEGEKNGNWEYQEACISTHHRNQLLS